MIHIYNISSIYVQWMPPPPYWLKMNIDGSSNGQIGGIGIVIRNEFGGFIAGLSKQVGKVTNDMAELWAIKDGLQTMSRLGVRQVQVESDSTFAIGAVSGSINYAWCFRPLVNDCKKIMESMSVVFLYVYREANKPADFLAKRSLHQDNVVSNWCVTPDLELGMLLTNNG
ncbi:Ribonuclease h protein [Thalictrum thalictroides]|uniref:Ribonuclease h protein n=1 Tax=Thalictrum thalictroides TaxID=46969 RepID=A0A7J6X4R4_THATH|nr:Ribonuclease h protein [Thalictrum thalictroides]